MKRARLILLVLLLAAGLLPAHAQTLANRLDAPERISQIYHSNSGKTTVTIDAAVTVPDAQRIPVYAIQPRKYTLEEIDALAQAAFGQEPYEGDREFQVHHRTIGPDSTFEHWDYDLLLDAQRRIPTGRTEESLPAAELLVWMTELPDGSIFHASAEYSAQQVIGEGYYFSNGLAWPLDRQPLGTQMSFEEARRIADAAVAAFAPGRQLAGAALLPDEIITSGSGHVAESSREGYALYYTLCLELPVTYAYGEINKAEFLETTQSELITVVVDDRGIRNLMFNWPHQVNGMLQEDAQLLSFPQVMDIAAKLLPLKYASHEREYPDTRIAVSDIRLGYMRVLQRAHPRQFHLIPVWDFFGGATFAKSKNASPTVTWDEAYHSLLTLNAMDGTVIDRDYGY
ncbi:MAG: DUF6034 family protein [Christensenellales bacterium]